MTPITSPLQRFQSTLPAWGETRSNIRTQQDNDFNPLSPHGERLYVCDSVKFCSNFNPLSPHGERRYSFRAFWRQSSISIHSPRMGRDRSGMLRRSARPHFNPLSPHGERRKQSFRISSFLHHFNPLSPHGERRVDFYA